MEVKLYVLHACKFVLFLMVSNLDDFLVEKRLMDEVRSHDILIIVGETGSGKTTRKFLFFVPMNLWLLVFISFLLGYLVLWALRV